MHLEPDARSPRRWIVQHRVAVLVLPAVVVIGTAVAQAVLVGDLTGWGAALAVLVALAVVGGWWAVVAWGVSVIRGFEADTGPAPGPGPGPGPGGRTPPVPVP